MTNTIALARKIILDQMGGSEGISKKEIQENMKIELPRASSYDEKIKKYSCEANLIAGGSAQLPIIYTSQLDDKNQHIVSVGGISESDLLVVQARLVEGIKKSRASKNQATPPPTPTVPNISGIWKGAEGEMVIKPASAGFDVALSVATASGCTGSIEGSASLSDNTLTLTKKEDDQVCTITIKFAGDTADIDENHCDGYRGATCGFGGTLKKIK